MSIWSRLRSLPIRGQDFPQRQSAPGEFVSTASTRARPPRPDRCPAPFQRIPISVDPLALARSIHGDKVYVAHARRPEVPTP